MVFPFLKIFIQSILRFFSVLVNNQKYRRKKYIIQIPCKFYKRSPKIKFDFHWQEICNQNACNKKISNKIEVA